MLFLWQKPHICTAGELDLSLAEFHVGIEAITQQNKNSKTSFHYLDHVNCDIRLIISESTTSFYGLYSPGGILGYKRDGGVRRIFLGLKFSTPGFFWVEDLTVYFWGLKNLCKFFGVRISARVIVLTQFKPKFPHDPKA